MNDAILVEGRLLIDNVMVSPAESVFFAVLDKRKIN
jgi:hypothetical protein